MNRFKKGDRVTLTFPDQLNDKEITIEGTVREDQGSEIDFVSVTWDKYPIASMYPFPANTLKLHPSTSDIVQS